MTPSSKFALAAAFLGTLDPGDEVLVLTPGWVSYDVAIQVAGAIPLRRWTIWRSDEAASGDRWRYERRVRSIVDKRSSAFSSSGSGWVNASRT